MNQSDFMAGAITIMLLEHEPVTIYLQFAPVSREICYVFCENKYRPSVNSYII